MNFVTIYFQLYHFNIWPQINAPLHNSFRKIYQFADITLKSNFFSVKISDKFLSPSKKISKNKCNIIYCKTSLAETNHAATKSLKFDIVCSFWFVKCLSYQYINIYFFSRELLLILKFLL